MDEYTDVVCVILAGGRGKRMASADCHKVCFPIAGRPAIVRAIDTYKEAGLRQFLVVVGQMAEQVLSTISRAHPEVSFVYQNDPRGTGHAAIVAVEALAARGYEGSVMIVMGDKVTTAGAVRKLLQKYRQTTPDVLLTTLPKDRETTAGRVVEGKGGEVLGLVETADIRKAREDGTVITVSGQEFTADEVEQRSLSVNASMYLFRFSPLQEALRHLSPSNAQSELYLTDTIEFLNMRGSVESMLVADRNELMAYNTPAELLAIEEVFLSRESAALMTAPPELTISHAYLKPAKQWLGILEDARPELTEVLEAAYGKDVAIVEERRVAMVQIVQAFIGQFGPDRPMVLCRAPGRINLMGRHVDHRGGFVNVMAINREALVAAAPRDDDVVRLRHLNVSRFPNREFRIYDLLGEETWSDWMDFLESHTVKRVLDMAPGDWSHYVRAPLLRLQYEHGHMRLKGMDCMVSGNIPMGAGLSSSSALVVAFAEAAVTLNGLDVTMRDFVDLCGEGEWFVGSRGGSADHAAIRTGQLGHITKIGFFPFRMEDDIPFPESLRLVIAHSGVSAVKSADARDVFNHRVAAYEFACMMLKNRWPAARGMQHLRDLTAKNLKLQPADVYRGLMLLPEFPDREGVQNYLPDEQHPRMKEVFGTHSDVGPYDLRGTALFGIAECERSDSFAKAMAEGDFAQVGAMMRASHDGDRCFAAGGQGKTVSFISKTSDGALSALADENSDLTSQPGSYACSTEAIDALVDIALSTDGVVGAQLAGAGLGGCMMTLVRDYALDNLLSVFRESFYEPRQLPFEVHVCRPVEGAGLIGVDL